ncbi:retrograde regulation protein 2 [Grosmannia clavigera kw1407]|uniref:Retrograde regulation protein 2 n=1 Tax=Grosmannia clavigera (strain kw1407 / UAMH 11150) TaxID=655863 RepID=F0X9F6_GROCL|nr:retrograde regulation protein 2 [Grosmannia clavigera kw1407]EFX05562.1 retrograde regulation protein 2 [Grosmannia clavigera kw1407]
MPTAVDIVTLDNFEDKLPKWSPDDISYLHALVDMGSNGIRFTISDLAPPYTRLLRCVYRERAGISLFDALTAKGEQPSSSDGSPQQPALSLPKDTIRDVANTLARFQRIALDFGVRPDHMAVFATEAMRRASNAAELLDSIGDKAPGLTVHVLAPEVETLFGSAGARAGFASVEGGLMLDLGGGSVQISYVDSRLGAGYETMAARTGQSMPYGAARLTRLVVESLPTETTTTATLMMTPEAKAKAESEATAAVAPALADDLTAALARLQEQFSDRAAAASAKGSSSIDVYLCGGGFRGYGSMLMHNDPVQPYPIPIMAGYTVSGALFGETQRMRHINHAEEGKIFGLSKRRRQQFGAIATVVDALITALARSHLNIRTVTFCAGGNREGALMLRLPPSIRETDPLVLLAGPSAATTAIADKLRSALPAAASSELLLSLLPIIASRIWERGGIDAASNAAASLHDAVHRDPATPGLPHHARAVLAISLWARWGGSVAPTDTKLLDGLRHLLGDGRGSKSHDAAGLADDAFWAEYVGGVAAVLALLFPAGPPSADALSSALLSVSVGKTPSGKKNAIALHVAVSSSRSIGLDLASAVEDCFGAVGKQHKKSIKLSTSPQPRAPIEDAATMDGYEYSYALLQLKLIRSEAAWPQAAGRAVLGGSRGVDDGKGGWQQSVPLILQQAGPSSASPRAPGV